MPSEELVDWISDDGSVIEAVARSEMRRRRLRHRATYIVVINSANLVAVHKRAAWKEVYPGWWDLAFGGVCGAGEDWQDAARRELSEEAGLDDVELEPIGHFSYDDHDGSLIGHCFVARTDEQIVPRDGEVVEVDWVNIADLGRWMDGRNVCRDSRQCVVPLLEGLNQPEN